jgi:hypothetical protein
MDNQNRKSLWATVAIVFIGLFLVTALAMAHGSRRSLYDRAVANAQSEMRPTTGEAKPSAAVGVIGPLKTPAKTKRARPATQKAAAGQ